MQIFRDLVGRAFGAVPEQARHLRHRDSADERELAYCLEAVDVVGLRLAGAPIGICVAERVVVEALGVSEARLYLADENDGIGGAGAFFLLLDEPEIYGLPPLPVVPTKHLATIWGAAAAAAGALAIGVAAAFLGGGE